MSENTETNTETGVENESQSQTQTNEEPLFTSEQLDDMTDNEKSLAEKLGKAVEKARAETAIANEKLAQSEKNFNDYVAKQHNKEVDTHLNVFSHGDEQINEQVKKNIAILEKTGEFADNIGGLVETAINMLSKETINDFNKRYGNLGNNGMESLQAMAEKSTSFADTQDGQQIGADLGLTLSDENGSDSNSSEDEKK